MLLIRSCASPIAPRCCRLPQLPWGHHRHSTQGTAKHRGHWSCADARTTSAARSRPVPCTHTGFTLLCCTPVCKTEPAKSRSPLPCAFCWFNLLNWLCRDLRSAIVRRGETKQEVKSFLNCWDCQPHTRRSWILLSFMETQVQQ